VEIVLCKSVFGDRAKRRWPGSGQNGFSAVGELLSVDRSQQVLVDVVHCFSEIAAVGCYGHSFHCGWSSEK
jgi:hypothetical protein